MIRTTLATATLLVGLSGLAVAQDRGKIPIEQDLRRFDRVERRIDETTGSIPKQPPFWPGDPSGVIGFSGPPGIVGDSVGSYGPLPPGAAGNEGW